MWFRVNEGGDTAREVKTDEGYSERQRMIGCVVEVKGGVQVRYKKQHKRMGQRTPEGMGAERIRRGTRA